MGIHWALDRKRMWTLGNPNLFIFTDHKPLIGLLQNKSFDDIDNPRLARFVQRTLRWKFHICHVKGLDNVSSDALSRYPWGEEPLIALLEGCMLGPECEDIQQEVPAVYKRGF